MYGKKFQNPMILYLLYHFPMMNNFSPDRKIKENLHYNTFYDLIFIALHFLCVK